ncbi:MULTISPECIES: protein YgfX [Pseudomonas]|uniref:Toxin CptA n=1 Tax=Pseudomonas mosselii TaxID=78327 RepID=A0A5R8Z3D0_9PSED|nr:protein YgfX [Pseudomonas mosselii]TLP60259.1 hypothetical protein FEM01_13770 [Pseudomonas mosselii]
MFSPSDGFECHWHGSRRLLVLYLACQALALAALWLSALPGWVCLAVLGACIAHAGWAIPRRILLSHPHAITGLRRDALGWWVFSRSQGWQSVRLRRDSVAVPRCVVLRFAREGRWWTESQCIAQDALDLEQHRRLRVRLKFGRRRWACGA